MLLDYVAFIPLTLKMTFINFFCHIHKVTCHLWPPQWEVWETHRVGTSTGPPKPTFFQLNKLDPLDGS